MNVQGDNNIQANNFQLRNTDPAMFIAVYCASGNGAHEDLWINYELLKHIVSDLDNPIHMKLARKSMNIMLKEHPNIRQENMSRWIAETTIQCYEEEMNMCPSCQRPIIFRHHHIT